MHVRLPQLDIHKVVQTFTGYCILDEGHGFRDSINRQNTLDGTLYFFSKVFGFEAADKPEIEVNTIAAKQ